MAKLTQPLADMNGLYKVEIIREGEWQYPKLAAKQFRITRQILKDLEDNFNAGTKGWIVPVNEEHNGRDVIGWVRKTEVGQNAEGSMSLWGWCSLDDQERKERVDSGKLKFSSAEINLGWPDPEDGGKKKTVLDGVALTAKPYIKRLAPIARESGSVLAVSLSEDEMRACGVEGCEPLLYGLSEDSELEGLRLGPLPDVHEKLPHLPDHSYAPVTPKPTPVNQDPKPVLDPARTLGAQRYKGLRYAFDPRDEPTIKETWDDLGRDSKRIREDVHIPSLGRSLVAEVVHPSTARRASGRGWNSTYVLRDPEKGHSIIGSIDYGRTDKGAPGIQISDLRSDYHGLGVGQIMYEHFLNTMRRFGHQAVYSDSAVSDKARAVYTKLRKLGYDVKANRPSDVPRDVWNDILQQDTDGQVAPDIGAAGGWSGYITKPLMRVKTKPVGLHPGFGGQGSLDLSEKCPFDESVVLAADYEPATEATFIGLPKLPHELHKFFDPGEHGQEIPMHLITPVRARHKGIVNGVSKMMEAYATNGSRREPISLVGNHESGYKVMDGNSTYAIAQHSEWPTIMGRVFPNETAALEHEAAIKAAKAARKAAALNLSVGAQGVHHAEPMTNISVDYSEAATKEEKQLYLDADSVMDESEAVNDEMVKRLSDASTAIGVPDDLFKSVVKKAYAAADGPLTNKALLESVCQGLCSHDGTPVELGKKTLLRALGYQASAAQGKSVDLSEGRGWTIADGDCLYFAETPSMHEYADRLGMIPLSDDAEDREFNETHKRNAHGQFDGSGTARHRAAKRPGNYGVAIVADSGTGRHLGPSAAMLSVEDGYFVSDDVLTDRDRNQFREAGFERHERENVRPGEPKVAWHVPSKWLDQFGQDNAAKSVTKEKFERLIDAAHRAALRIGYGAGETTLTEMGLPTGLRDGLAYVRAKGPNSEAYARVIAAKVLRPIAKRFLDFDDVSKGKYRAVDLVRAYLNDRLPSVPLAPASQMPALAPVLTSGAPKAPWAADYAGTTTQDVQSMLSAVKGQLRKTDGGFLDVRNTDDARRRLLTVANACPDVVADAGLTKAQILREIGAGPDSPDASLAGLKTEAELNHGVPEQYHWVGMSNVNTLGYTKFDATDLKAFVKDVRFETDPDWDADAMQKQAEVLKHNAGLVMMAFDSNISYKHLTFVVKSLEPGVRGIYDSTSDTIYMVPGVTFPTVPHEMTHAIDSEWGREFTPSAMDGVMKGEIPAYRGLSSMGDAIRMGWIPDHIHPEKIEWAKAVCEFVENLQDRTETIDEYHLTPWEVFARFGDYFVNWTLHSSTNPKAANYKPEGTKDKFKEQDAMTFVRLLQWKAYLNVRYPR